MKMKTTSHIAISLAILVAGAFVVGFLLRPTSQGGTGNGIGFFKYDFNCFWFPDVEGDPSISHIKLEGHAPKRFMLHGGVSPAYETIAMEWELNAGYIGRPEGSLTLDLANGTIIDGDRKAPLDSEHLFEVMEIPDRQANRTTFKHLLNLLDDCQKGELPKPSHHGYGLREPIEVRIRHAAHGKMVPTRVLDWVKIWFFGVIAFHAARWIKNFFSKPYPSG